MHSVAPGPKRRLYFTSTAPERVRPPIVKKIEKHRGPARGNISAHQVYQPRPVTAMITQASLTKHGHYVRPELLRFAASEQTVKIEGSRNTYAGMYILIQIDLPEDSEGFLKELHWINVNQTSSPLDFSDPPLKPVGYAAWEAYAEQAKHVPQAKSKYAIYALVHPVDNTVVYVGKTSTPLNVRLGYHLAKPSKNVRKWLATLDQKPEIRLLQAAHRHHVNQAEIEWIAWGRTQGVLLNTDPGGNQVRTKNQRFVNKILQRHSALRTAARHAAGLRRLQMLVDEIKD